MIVQLPIPVSVTILPNTVQFPLAVNVTANPDEAVALTVKGGSVTILFGSDTATDLHQYAQVAPPLELVQASPGTLKQSTRRKMEDMMLIGIWTDITIAMIRAA